MISGFAHRLTKGHIKRTTVPSSPNRRWDMVAQRCFCDPYRQEPHIAPLFQTISKAESPLSFLETKHPPGPSPIRGILGTDKQEDCGERKEPWWQESCTRTRSRAMLYRHRKTYRRGTRMTPPSAASHWSRNPTTSNTKPYTVNGNAR